MDNECVGKWDNENYNHIKTKQWFAGPTGRLNQWVFVDTYKLTNVCMIIDDE